MFYMVILSNEGDNYIQISYNRVWNIEIFSKSKLLGTIRIKVGKLKMPWSITFSTCPGHLNIFICSKWNMLPFGDEGRSIKYQMPLVYLNISLVKVRIIWLG